ncbi:MAG: hypothetical protein ABSG05_02085 [Candidatus Pacearchaeota archaeon]|jgi:hypothetical protein
MKRDNNSHKRALEKIASSAGKLGIENTISVLIEPTLLDRGRIITQPDVVFETRNGEKEVYIIEYKCNGNGELLERAKKQLETAVWWYGKYRPDVESRNIHTRIISGDDPKYKEILK